MPVSSGFSFYRTNNPTPRRIVRPQIVSRALKFRDIQRNKKQNGLFSNSKATAGGKLPAQRPTVVVKQPIRSDTFTLPTKRDETNFKVPKVNQTENGSRRQATNKPAVIKSSPPAEQKRTETMRQNGTTRSMLKQSNSRIDRQNLQRKPVRFANNYNNTYYSSSPASLPVYYQKTAPLTDPLPRDTLEKSRHMHLNNDDYVIHRRKDSPAYAYNDYHTVSDIPTISYATSLPPISQSTNQTAPTVIIHPKEPHRSDPPTVIIHSKENYYSEPQTVIPSYPSSAPFMFLPSSAGPSYPQTSTMFLPTTTAPTQPSVQTFYLQPPPTSNYLSQPYFYPMPFSNPRPYLPFSAPPPPPVPIPVPPPVQPTIINQSSSSSSSAPTTVKTENKTEENNATIIVHPNTLNHNKKNVTIQLKMLDEESLSPQRVVHVVREPPYREAEDVYYVHSKPRHRTAFVRRPPPLGNEYVYVNEPSSTINRRDPYRSEVVYVDNDRPLEYEEEIVYVDDHNNNIEYIYDDEPVYHRRNSKRSRYPTSTNIVYE